MENWSQSSRLLALCLVLFSVSRWVDLFEVLDFFALLLDAIHVNTVSDSNVVTCPFENLIRAHSLFSLWLRRIPLLFFLIFLRKRRCLKTAFLVLNRIGLRLESFIDFQLTGKSVFHALCKRVELGYVGNHKGVHLEPVGHELLVEQKIRRLNKSSIIVHIK